MAYTIVCECGKRMHLAERYAGRTGHCPDCGRSFQVPVNPEDRVGVAGSGEQYAVDDDAERAQTAAIRAAKAKRRCPNCGHDMPGSGRVCVYCGYQPEVGTVHPLSSGLTDAATRQEQARHQRMRRVVVTASLVLFALLLLGGGALWYTSSAATPNTTAAQQATTGPGAPGGQQQQLNPNNPFNYFKLLAKGRQRARATVALSNMNQFKLAIEMYRNLHGEFPESLEDVNELLGGQLDALMVNPATGENPGFIYKKPPPGANLAETPVIWQLEGGKKKLDAEALFADGHFDEP